MIDTVLQLLISGIAMGFIYALVGVEYTIVFNSIDLLNFAHERFILLSAYIFAGTFAIQMGLSAGWAIFAGLIFMALFGAVVAVGIFNPLRNMPSRLYAIMGTIALGRIITESTRLIYGPLPFTLPNFITGVFRVGNLVIARANVLIIAVAVFIVAVLQFYMRKTKQGKAMRCVNQNKVAASLMGINVSQNIVITIAISTVICSVIGVLCVPLYSIESGMTTMIGLKGFAAGVIGGFGYLPGAIVGGLLVGMIENLSVLILPAVFKDCVAYVLLIVFMLVMPKGILGNKK